MLEDKMAAATITDISVSYDNSKNNGKGNPLIDNMHGFVEQMLAEATLGEREKGAKHGWRKMAKEATTATYGHANSDAPDVEDVGVAGVGDVVVEAKNTQRIQHILKGAMRGVYTLHKFVSKGDGFITKSATRLSDNWPCIMHIVNKGCFNKHGGEGKLVDVPTFVAEHMGIAKPVAVIESPDRLYVVEAGAEASLTPAVVAASVVAVEETEAAVVEPVDLPDFSGSLSHSLRLSSAYPDSTPFTNFTETFNGCLDYIFAGPTLQLVSVEPLLTLEEASRHTALPSPVWPSDHLLLAATFAFPC
jgi:hypothetical protein